MRFATGMGVALLVVSTLARRGGWRTDDRAVLRR